MADPPRPVGEDGFERDKPDDTGAPYDVFGASGDDDE